VLGLVLISEIVSAAITVGMRISACISVVNNPLLTSLMTINKSINPH
jgi:hypothetical protein